jgi:2-dehydropantoate 2-reductase
MRVVAVVDIVSYIGQRLTIPAASRQARFRDTGHMRILILGAGGIGGYFGGHLAAAGADVTFLVRPARSTQLERDGLAIISPLGNLQLPVKTSAQIDQPFDLILLACKAFDLGSAMQAISPAVGKNSTIVPLLNGLRHLDSLDQSFPSAHILGGLCHIGVTLRQDGKIEHLNELQHLSLGSRLPGQQFAAHAAHKALTCGGFAPVLSKVILQEMWEKFVFLASYAGVTCMMRAPIGAIARSGCGRSIAAELLSECSVVATAAGFPPRSRFLVDSLKTLTDETSTGTSSMLRDLLRGARTEHDHILGDMLARATALGISTPVLRIADTILRAYEMTRPASAA